MRCPYCGHHDLKVVDSRDSEVGEAIRRRRECLQCGQRFTTYERIEAVPFYVTKKDGRREDFDPQKLFTGLKKATEKRDISPERLRAIVDDIEAELRHSGRVEIPLAIYQRAADELVPVSGVARQVQRLQELGYRYRFYVFPHQEHYGPPVQDQWSEWLRTARKPVPTP